MNTRPLESKVRDEIVAYGRLLYAQGLVSGASGNISARLDTRHIIMTPSGCHKGLMTADDLLVFNMESGQVEWKTLPEMYAAYRQWEGNH